MTHRILVSGCLCFATAFSYGAEPSRHVQLQEGESFLFRQVTEARGERMRVSDPRFKVGYENKANQFVILVTEGRPASMAEAPIYQTAHVLAKSACVVDVLGGMALRGAEACESGLPDSWSFPYPAFPDSVSCKSIGTSEELEVPAGKFATLAISCVRELFSPQRKVVTVYAYAPAVGVMVSSVRRTYDSKGALISTSTDKLVAHSK